MICHHKKLLLGCKGIWYIFSSKSLLSVLNGLLAHHSSDQMLFVVHYADNSWNFCFFFQAGDTVELVQWQSVIQAFFVWRQCHSSAEGCGTAAFWDASMLNNHSSLWYISRNLVFFSLRLKSSLPVVNEASFPLAIQMLVFNPCTDWWYSLYKQEFWILSQILSTHVTMIFVNCTYLTWSHTFMVFHEKLSLFFPLPFIFRHDCNYWIIASTNLKT